MDSINGYSLFINSFIKSYKIYCLSNNSDSINGNQYNEYALVISVNRRNIGHHVFYKIFKVIEDKYENYRERSVSERTVIRNKANRFISRKNIRNIVFKKHGRKCLCCGAKTGLSIDHVIPISIGGKDELSNLQPLCKSCNSSKGTKKTDYRHE